MNRQIARHTSKNTFKTKGAGLPPRTAIHSIPEKTKQLSVSTSISKASHFEHDFSRVPVDVDRSRVSLEQRASQRNASGMGGNAEVKDALASQVNGEAQGTANTDQYAPEHMSSTMLAEKTETTPRNDELVPDEANIETPLDSAAGIVIRGDYPRVTPKEYWYFDGETPPSYTVSSVLSTNRSSGAFSWSVSPHLSLSSSTNATPTVTTAAPSSARDDAWIRVRHVDGSGVRTSASYGVTVLAPNSLDHQSTTHAPRGASFHTQVKYHILDQFRSVLPRNIPWNEDFNKDVLRAVTGIRDYSDARENWGWGPESGWAVPPNNAVDHISRGTPPGRFPTPMRPQSPLTNTKIDHVIGSWFVGSTTIGSGRLVKDNNKWQIYIDHGAHE